MQDRPTMQQVADELGLSRLTVSSVVNNRAEERRISPATVERVRAYLNQRGYVRSRRAVDLRAKCRDGVGLLHTGRLYSHLTEAFNLLTNSLNDAPQRLEIVVVRPADLVRGVRELVARGVSQLVWIQTRSPGAEFPDPHLLNYLTHVRTVVYNYRFGEGDLDGRLIKRGLHLVGIDRSAGYRRLARFLRGLGHKVLALPDLAPGEDRESGLERALLDAGFEVVRSRPKDMKVSSPREVGRALAAGVLGAMRRRRVSGACFGDDEVAGHAMSTLLRRGVRIPGDLTVTGFDGIAIAEAFAVPLTTVRIPVGAMVGRVRRILSRAGKPRAHRFEPELVRGGSHARVRA